MSWLARSIANSLKLDDDDDDASNAKLESKHLEDTEKHLLQNDDGASPTSPSRGVKNDLSDLTKTLTRQLWGVASFLAPPPPQPLRESETEDSDADVISGIRSDFAEIGGKFKSGISRLSNNINVSEITKLASDFLQLGSDDEGEKEGNREGSDSPREGAVGVTEEVVAFSRDIAMHPETWLEFPLPEGDDVDFDLSDAQQEHALAVERLAPRLAALRIELCPGYMSESCFWKIYFVLLHPRLNSHDAELLSTSQIMKARASLAQELNNRNPMKLDDLSGKRSYDPEDNVGSHNNAEPLSVPSPVLSTNENNKASNLEIPSVPALAVSETVKHSTESNEMQIVDKPAIKEKDVDQVKDQNLKSGFSNVGENDEDDADDWLEEESSEIGATSGVTIPIENEDDVSFSDLEEDDEEAPTTFKKSNDKGSPDWVQLGKSSDIDIKHSDNESVNVHKTKESNDWLDVDDIDVA